MALSRKLRVLDRTIIKGCGSIILSLMFIISGTSHCFLYGQSGSSEISSQLVDLQKSLKSLSVRLNQHQNNVSSAKIAIGFDLNGVFFRKQNSIKTRVNQRVVSLIKEIRKEGYPVFLISNTMTKKLKQLRREHKEFGVFTDYYIRSYANMKKSNPDFFVKLRKWLAQKGYASNRLIFFDDQPKYVDSANLANKHTTSYNSKKISINITPYLFTSPSHARKILIKEGIFPKKSTK